MTDSTQPQDVAGAFSDAAQGMPRTDTGRAASVDVAAQALLMNALGRAPWRTLPPTGPWRSPELRSPELRRNAP